MGVAWLRWILSAGGPRGVLWLSLWVGIASGGCSPPYFQADETRRQMAIDWGPQVERATFDEVVDHCERGLSMRFAPGVYVKFLDDPTSDCRTGHDRVAGCWIHDFDLILLAPADHLAATALCHELLHRQLFLDEGHPDAAHVRPEWALLGTVLQALRRQEGEPQATTR